MEFVPPRRVFQNAPKPVAERQQEGTYDIPGFLYTIRTSNGGMATVFQGHPFPRKGFIYGEAVTAVAKAKRITLALFQPLTDIRKGIIGFIESYLNNYTKLVDIVFSDCERIPYLHYEYYCEFSKGTWDFTFLFLRRLAISFSVANKTGLILATIFENDDAYRVRAQDIFSESSKEAMLKNPRKELNRLLDIYLRREYRADYDNKDKIFSKERELANDAGIKIKKFAKLASLALLLPPIKKAFKRTLEDIDFTWFQYDDLDGYWALNRGDYDTFGRPLKDRMEEMVGMMHQHAEKVTGKKHKRVYNEDGTINLIIDT